MWCLLLEGRKLICARATVGKVGRYGALGAQVSPVKFYPGPCGKTCEIQVWWSGSKGRSQKKKWGRGLKGNPWRVDWWSSKGHVDQRSIAAKQQMSRTPAQPKEHRYSPGGWEAVEPCLVRKSVAAWVSEDSSQGTSCMKKRQKDPVWRAGKEVVIPLCCQRSPERLGSIRWFKGSGICSCQDRLADPGTLKRQGPASNGCPEEESPLRSTSQL